MGWTKSRQSPISSTRRKRAILTHMSKRRTYSRLDNISALETVWLPLVTSLSFEDQLALIVYTYDDDLDELAAYLESQQRFPRDLVMDVAVAHGCVRTIKRFLRVKDVQLYPGLAHATAMYSPNVLNKRTHVMRWLNRYRPRVYCEEAMMMAAQRGDLELVQWLHTTCVYDVEAAMCTAAKRGHLTVAQWLGDNLSSALPVGSKKSAAIDVEILIRLDAKVSAGRVLYWAIRRGEEITRWFCVCRDHGEEHALLQKSTDGVICHGAFVMDALSFAVSLGDEQLTKQIDADKTFRPEWTEALAVATRRGNLAMVQWLRCDCAYGIPQQTMVEAAIGGNTAVIEWLHESCGISPDCYGMLYVGCQFGRLEVVQWVCNRSPDLALDPVRWAQVCCPELKQKELKLVQDHWVGWNFAEAYRMIDQSGDSAERVRQVLEWLLSVHKLEIKRESEQLMLNVAIACGSVARLETLPRIVGYRERGMAFSLAGELGRMDVLTSILSRLRGRGDIEEFFRYVACSGSREIIEVLLRTHPQYCNFMPSRGLLNLVRKGHLEMARNIIESGELRPHPLWHETVKDFFHVSNPREQLQLLMPVATRTHSPVCKYHEFFVQWCLLSERVNLRNTSIRYAAICMAQCENLDLLCQLIKLGVDEEAGYEDLYANNREVLASVLKCTEAGDVVCLLLEQSPSLMSEEVLTWAVGCRQLNVLQYMLTLPVNDEQTTQSMRNCELVRTTMLCACRLGRLEVLEWVERTLSTSLLGSKSDDDNGCSRKDDPWRRSQRVAALAGQIQVLKWLDGRGYDSNEGDDLKLESLFVAVCRYDHVDVAKWLWEQYRVVRRAGQRGLSRALEHGNSELVVWLSSMLLLDPSDSKDCGLLERVRAHLLEEQA